MTERFRCAATSRERGDDLGGTASTARRWLAVEQPGPWGVDALADSRLAPDVAEGLRALCGRIGLRVVLIRRPGRDDDSGRRTALAAFTGPRDAFAERFTFDDPADLLNLDWSPLAENRPVGGEPLERPVYLACTHGGHDACCAEFGRPTAAALADAAGERLWESSHVGGDRFAANVVALPHGVYYGRVGPADAADLVTGHDAGRLSLRHFRGRSCYAFVVQAAEAALRAHLDERGVDALPLAARPRRAGAVRTITFLAQGGAHEVDVAVHRADARRLTCRSAQEARPPEFTTVDIRPV